MNADEQVIGSTFRDRFTRRPYLPSADRRRFGSDTKLKYNKYEQDGKSIFVVTLSTYVTSEKFANSDRMRRFWVRDFLYRVTELLPFNLKESIDHDYVIERSPKGHYHYHGLLAMPKESGDRIWKNGMLNKELARDLASLRTKSEYRDFAVNSFRFEPVRPDKSIDHWVSYMTQTEDYIASSAW